MPLPFLFCMFFFCFFPLSFYHFPPNHHLLFLTCCAPGTRHGSPFRAPGLRATAGLEPRLVLPQWGEVAGQNENPTRGFKVVLFGGFLSTWLPKSIPLKPLVGDHMFFCIFLLPIGFLVPIFLTNSQVERKAFGGGSSLF